MQPQTLPDTTTPPAEPARDLTAATALLRRLYAAGWEGDYVGAGHFGGTEYAICHGAGGQAAVVLDGLNQVMELRISGTVMTLDQAVVAVDAAGLAPAAPTTDPQPSGRLLAAVREVIAAGHLDEATDGDVELAQGDAHARLVAAYEAVTGAPQLADPTNPPARPAVDPVVTAQRLQAAVVKMAVRYANSRQDYAHALNAPWEVRGRHLATSQRRFAALMRLAGALSGLAGGTR
ncbi:hypothetical protein OG271_03795 [Micromonospora rifamycinica]|uniref:hypothetical protein n=1 Tax=Micromonospora rifamycinica TaxID=291594 RepID=UPI002E29A041|nr:hypothetical protein [Micromonospora rifamycinica]